MHSLRDLPFNQVPPLALFGLDPTRDAPAELEHTRHGWCALPGIELVGEDQALWIEAPIVLALHSPDEDEIAVPRRGGVPGDINLEFVLEDERSVIALLSEFLALEDRDWRTPEARPIVLALCNPHKARISRPPALAGRRIYYGTGEVVAWLRQREGASGWSLEDEAFVQLESLRWYTC